MSNAPENLQEREEFWPGGTRRARWFVLLRDGKDVRHGLYEEFHENGMLARRGFYREDSRSETWTTWDNQGRQLFSEEVADDAQNIEAPEPDAEAWNEPVDPADEAERALPRGRWMLECLVVMALAWLAPMTYAIFSEGYMLAPENWSFLVEKDDWAVVWTQVPALAASLQIFIPLLYIISRSDLSWSEIGVVAPRWWGLLLAGPLLAAASLGADALLVWVFEPPDPPGYIAYPVGVGAWLLLGIALLANSLAEEFVWRGYMLRRFKQLGGSPVFALLVSSALFAAYHVYQGWANAGLVMVSGLIWGVAVLWLKRIWPVVVAHTIHNLLLYTPVAEFLFPA